MTNGRDSALSWKKPESTGVMGGKRGIIIPKGSAADVKRTWDDLAPQIAPLDKKVRWLWIGDITLTLLMIAWLSIALLAFGAPPRSTIIPTVVGIAAIVIIREVRRSAKKTQKRLLYELADDILIFWDEDYPKYSTTTAPLVAEKITPEVRDAVLTLVYAHKDLEAEDTVNLIAENARATVFGRWARWRRRKDDVTAQRIYDASQGRTPQF